MQRSSRLAFVLAALSTVAATAMGADAPLHLNHAWHVSLDAKGKVTALADVGNLAAGVRDPLERAIRAWSFEAGQVNGTPAPTETTLVLDVTFLPGADGNYAVRIDDARTGGAIDTKSSMVNPPHMPRDVVKPGFMGRVVVKADYDADGKIIAVTPQADQGFHATRSLDAATVKAVRKWKVTPEQVGGHGVAASVMVPICYTVTTGRAPDVDCSWTPPGSKSTVDNGAAFALAPSTKLLSDVIGHAL